MKEIPSFAGMTNKAMHGDDEKCSFRGFLRRHKNTTFFKNAKRVLHLKVCHIISGDLWAGAEVMAWKLIQQLQRFADMDLQLLLLNEGRLAAELRRLGLSVTIVDESRSAFPQLLSRVHAFIRQASPDVIHSHRYKENILGFLGRGLKTNIRLIATQHGMPEGHIARRATRSSPVAKLNRYLLARRFDQLVAVSKDIEHNFIHGLGFTPDKVSVIYNGIEVPDRPASCKDRPVVIAGSAGRLFPVKDYVLMTRIAKAALGEGSNLEFELAGEGPQRTRLEALLEDFAIRKSFRLRGHIDDMDRFYAHLDIYLNTSVHEGIPMSILEAMAHGLPVVAPKVGGIVEIIDDGVEGFLVSDRTPEAFAEKVLLLAQNRSLRQGMGLAAREKVMNHFSASAMARNYQRLYQAVSQKSPLGQQRMRHAGL